MKYNWWTRLLGATPEDVELYHAIANTLNSCSDDINIRSEKIEDGSFSGVVMQVLYLRDITIYGSGEIYFRNKLISPRFLVRHHLKHLIKRFIRTKNANDTKNTKLNLVKILKGYNQ